MSDTEKNYGEYLAKIRKELGVKQIDLADKMGAKIWNISDYETGRSKMYDEVIMKCAKALNVTPNDLLGYTDKTDISQKFSFLLKQVDALPENEQRRFLEIMSLYLKGIRAEMNQESES